MNNSNGGKVLLPLDFHLSQEINKDIQKQKILSCVKKEMFNITINNFRSFLNQPFNFSRINILIGENSAGKSSLLKFLLSLKQSFDSPEELNLKLTGDYVDLGNYEEAIYYRKLKQYLTFSFEFGQSYFDFFLNFMIDNKDLDEDRKDYKKLFDAEKKKIIKYLKAYIDSTTKITFRLNSKLNNHFSIKTVIENNLLGKLELIQVKQPELFLQTYRKCDLQFEISDIKDKLTDVTITKEAFLSLVHGEVYQMCKKKFKRRGEEMFYKLAFLLVTQNFVKTNIQSLKYVNPIKTVPQRFYFQEDKKFTYKLIDIEKFINILGDKTLTDKARDIRITLMNKFVKSFGLAEEIRIVRHDTLPVLALDVKTKDLWSNITDVGYGVSLQIPILFQAILSEVFSRTGDTILIEQPEVHLHPSLQAKFIENLLSIGKKNVYFIETHSEHIIRKLQLLIKNKEFQLKPSDVSIHYFKRDEKKFSITSHSINENGLLTPSFPHGFYDVSYNLVKDLL